MSSKRTYELTPEQRALAQARKLKKERLAAQPETVVGGKGSIMPRQWLQMQDPSALRNSLDLRVKVFTWNLLAQCLVRRELFPTSDCLKASQREDMLHSELLSQKADVLFLQEVDRLEKLQPLLSNAGYNHQYGSGPRKKHGCMIAYNSSFRQIDYRVICYDDEDVRLAETERARRGSSFQTKNIGLLLVLQSTQNPEKGLIAATTHLFWHPRYTYERARQAGILMREVNRFRTDVGHSDWPCVIAGDFNFAPDDPAYSLLVGDPLLPEQEALISLSRVVHMSIDPSVPTTGPISKDDEGEDGSTTDPDRTITNARPAAEDDGLLSIPELVALFQNQPKLRSAYDEGLSWVGRQSLGLTTFGSRVSLSPGRRGSYEPEWTSYTHYWKTVLDYIFIQDPTQMVSTISGLLKPYTTQDLDPGLPKKGVSASDHVSLCADISWQETR